MVHRARVLRRRGSPHRAYHSGGVITEYSTAGGPNAAGRTAGITVGPDGDIWYTIDYFNDYYGVGHIDPFTFAAQEWPIARYTAPWGITAGSDGNLWVALQNANSIAKVTTSGVITYYETATEGDHRPSWITSGPDGNLWFTEATGNRIGRMTTGGAVTEFTLPTAFSSPAGIVTGPDGNLWFAERGGNEGRVGKITTGGTITEYLLGPGLFSFYTHDVAVGPDSKLWFTVNDGNGVGFIARVASNGTGAMYWEVPGTDPGHYCVCQGIARGPDGKLWFTERAANKIGRITAKPAPTLTLDPASGVAGSRTDVTGKGFGAYEVVKLKFAGIGVGRATTDANGRFSKRVRIPTETAPGTYNITARGVTSNIRGTAPFTVA